MAKTIFPERMWVLYIPFFVLACALAIVGTAQAQTFSVLHSFRYFPHGASPYAPLYRDTNGNLYGTTNGGGPYDAGVVFKIDTAGNQTVLHTFTGGTDGENPTAGVVMDSAENLYGTTYQGGVAGAGVNKQGGGVVFKIDASGRYTVLYSFTGGADGSGPCSSATLDPAGNLYGTTYNGGAAAYGVVYKLSPSGKETVIHSFTGSSNDGANPYAGVTMDATGNLYGTTYNGGGYGGGVVYKLSPSGQETLLYTFGTLNPASNHALVGVILDPVGNIYGASYEVVYKLDTSGKFTTLYQFSNIAGVSGLARDGSTGALYITLNANSERDYPNGALFKLDTSGKLTSLYRFKGATTQSGIWLPIGSGGYNAGVILDSAGNLYGTTPFQGTAGIVYEIEASGKNVRLYGFQPSSGGVTPWSGLTLDSAGNLYGTTRAGGGTANAGVVYKLSPTGREIVLYKFKGGTTDGSYAESGVVLDQTGNLYGVTARGGTANLGVVYKLSPSGQETILHSFMGGADGGLPTGLTIDSAWNLYGTTVDGGIGSQTGLQEGVVFKLDTAGSFSVLYSFTGLSDGGNPNAGVILDAAGNLYGTTYYGGLGYPGAGTVFKIDTTGAYSVLHAFLASTDGGGPTAGVVMDAEGNLYGTCSGYGPRGGGTVYKLNTAGNFSVLYAFRQGPQGYGYPMAGVALDQAGNIYGTITAGSVGPGGPPGSYGQVYKISASGTKTVLYSFTGGTDGADPTSPVTLDGAGRLYGIASGLFFTPVGGGTAFRITLP